MKNEKIENIIFKLRQSNSEYMQDVADELEQALNEIKIYKVYDDEWEDIMGNKDLQDFALMQLMNKYDDLDSDDKTKDLKKIARKVFKNDYTDLTMDEIDVIFATFDFEYEELYIN